MRPEALVLDPPTAKLGSTSGSLLRHQSQPQELQQVPLLEVAEWLQRRTAIGGVRLLGSAP